MSTITMSFRATNEDRNYLTGLDVPLTQLMRDLIVSLKRGKITYGADGFSGKEPVENEPIENISRLCSILRRIGNEDYNRQIALLSILSQHPKAIIFYNFDYERDILLELLSEKVVAEWNGHKHEPIPVGDEWIYLVQYTAGAEGWNCIETDTIIFYSLNYSYKATEQAMGRIDRLNTPFIDLYYYFLYSKSSMDVGIRKCLKVKKDFNESRYFKRKKQML